MRLRFWEPAHWSPSGPPGGVVLAPRVMHLTELRTFAEAMSRAMTGGDQSYAVRYGEQLIKFEEIDRLLDDQRGAVRVEATGNPATPYTSGDGLSLWLNTEGTAAALFLVGDAAQRAAPQLEMLWRRLGRPRRRATWLYPSGFLAVVAAALAGLIVGWSTGAVSLWLLPFAVGVLLLAFPVAIPLLQQRVTAHWQRRQGLVIDPRYVETVRRDKAVRRRQRRDVALSGVAGAALGASASFATTWLTIHR